MQNDIQLTVILSQRKGNYTEFRGPSPDYTITESIFEIRRVPDSLTLSVAEFCLYRTLIRHLEQEIHGVMYQDNSDIQVIQVR